MEMSHQHPTRVSFFGWVSLIFEFAYFLKRTKGTGAYKFIILLSVQDKTADLCQPFSFY